MYLECIHKDQQRASRYIQAVNIYKLKIYSSQPTPYSSLQLYVKLPSTWSTNTGLDAPYVQSMLQLREKFSVTILPVNLPIRYHRLKPIPRSNLNKIRLVILYLLPKSCSQDHHSQVKTTQYQRRLWLGIQPLPVSPHFTCPCDEHKDPFIIALQLLYPCIKLTNSL